LNQIVSAVFGSADDVLGDEMVKGLGAMLPGTHPQQIPLGIGEFDRRMGTIRSPFFQIFDDENIGAFKSPGMKLSGQNEDQNQDTDSDYEVSIF